MAPGSDPVEKFHAYPRQGNFEEKQQLILQEAARLFVEKGVHETSLSDVANSFGLSKPALYHYARNKDDIIAQILRAARTGYREMIEQSEQTQARGIDRLRSALETYCKAVNTEFGRCLALIQVGTFSTETARLHRDTHRSLISALTQLIEEGINEGSIKPCRPQIAALTIIHTLNGMARWYREDGSLNHDEVTHQVIDHLFNGLAA